MAAIRAERLVTDQLIFTKDGDAALRRRGIERKRDHGQWVNPPNYERCRRSAPAVQEILIDFTIP
jgi:hypothetical protein